MLGNTLINGCTKKLCKTPQLYVVSKRFRKKERWQDKQRKKLPTDKALAHFDDFYKTVFRSRWPSIRLALLCPQKYVALVNNFGEIEKTELDLKNSGAIDLKSMFSVYKTNLSNVKKENEKNRQLEEIRALDKKLELKINEAQENDLGNFTGGVNTSTDADNMDRLVDPEFGSEGSSLNEFVPVTKLKGMEDFVGESEYYNFYKDAMETDISVIKDPIFKFPENLKVYTYERGNTAYYAPPKKCVQGVFNYYLMDGSSILPVLALDVNHGDRVLDMCAAPGGKSLTILQTLNPRVLVCNDSSVSRIRKLQSVFDQFLCDYENDWKDILLITRSNALEINDTNFYDKILVDVPCTNDRLSLHEPDNNIFKTDRVKERLRLPELQAMLLTQALKLLRSGGTCVYSTCSLSPIQNDGVVAMAIRRAQDADNQFSVRDLTPTMECFSDLFKFARGLKYGQLVLPFLPINFGPMYFSKIVKH